MLSVAVVEDVDLHPRQVEPMQARYHLERCRINLFRDVGVEHRKCSVDFEVVLCGLRVTFLKKKIKRVDPTQESLLM